MWKLQQKTPNCTDGELIWSQDEEDLDSIMRTLKVEYTIELVIHFYETTTQAIIENLNNNERNK